eukprot:6058705-Amphidinium_carterae.1
MQEVAYKAKLFGAYTLLTLLDQLRTCTQVKSWTTNLARAKPIWCDVADAFCSTVLVLLLKPGLAFSQASETTRSMWCHSHTRWSTLELLAQLSRAQDYVGSGLNH